jgi:hypothetical protein
MARKTFGTRVQPSKSGSASGAVSDSIGTQAPSISARGRWRGLAGDRRRQRLERCAGSAVQCIEVDDRGDDAQQLDVVAVGQTGGDGGSYHACDSRPGSVPMR